MHTPPRVGVFIETTITYSRHLLTGINRYARSHGQWSLFLIPDHRPTDLWLQIPGSLTSEPWDGIICRANNPDLPRLLQTMNVPLIDVNDFYDAAEFPWVGSDHPAIGQAGAAHLIERGFTQFAFYGATGAWWSEQRKEAFCAAVTEKEFPVSVFERPFYEPGTEQWAESMEALGRWIGSLPKPVALMACNDMRALNALSACDRINARVPDEVAVLGVDNEELTCEMSTPTLSSVAPDPERVGYEAAQMLDAWMAGTPPTMPRTLIPPLRVVGRRSTDCMASSDWVVAGATRYIREQALRGCKVGDVQKHLGVSEATLRRHFLKSLNRSPQDEIHRVQLERIRTLLAETDYTLEYIATLAGFEHPEYMSVVFKRLTGQTPGEYRKQYKNVPITAANSLPHSSG